jgi:hypothetical protein
LAVGDGDGPEIAPPVEPPSVWGTLLTNKMLGARLLNCLLKNSVKPALNPLTATSKLLPAITIKIVRTDLTFLSLIALNARMKICLKFIGYRLPLRLLIENQTC